MKKELRIICAGAMLTACLATQGFAESVIRERKENQQDRIAQGVKNGSLTAKETAKLEHKEAKLNKEIRRDRAANGGTLTARERVRVNRQQNRISSDIYKQKHDAQTQPK